MAGMTLTTCAMLLAVDGDTVRCDGQNNLLLMGDGGPCVSGFDTPELGWRPDCRAENRLGIAAAARLSELADTEGLRIEESGRLDRHDRPLVRLGLPDGSTIGPAPDRGRPRRGLDAGLQGGPMRPIWFVMTTAKSCLPVPRGCDQVRRQGRDEIVGIHDQGGPLGATLPNTDTSYEYQPPLPPVRQLRHDGEVARGLSKKLSLRSGPVDDLQT